MVVESDSVCVTPDNGSDWAPGDPCMSAVLRFTESGWLTGTRVAVESLRKLTPKRLKDLKKEANRKGVWLEHRPKGKLADATRTYWLVDAQGLAASLPADQSDEPMSVAKPGDAARPCESSHLWCTFTTTGNKQSMNAHSRFCRFKPGLKPKQKPKVLKAVVQKREKKEKKEKKGGKEVKEVAKRSTRRSRVAAVAHPHDDEPEDDELFDAPDSAMAEQVRRRC